MSTLTGLFRRPRRRHASRPAERIVRVPLPAGMPGVTDTALYVPDTEPAPAYRPHGIDTPEVLAAIRAQAYADALAAQETEPTVTGRVPVPPSRPAPPPPMPPADLSRIMVAQIPPPPVNDRNFGWRHEYADYMRRAGVATGTSTDLEHTMAWGIPALKPGDGTGDPL